MRRENHSFRFTHGVYPRLVAIARFKGKSATTTVEVLINEEYSRLFPPISNAIHTTNEPYTEKSAKGGSE